ncbi:MAG: DUF692 domain-containing protein [Vampirovibrionales bacterium]|nr:DUF692 domain-containing protein [Vampirovibrionales bacterium]
MFQTRITEIPTLGFGLGLKDKLAQGLLQRGPDNTLPVDWLELIPENYVRKGGNAAQNLDALIQAGYPFASHGVNLSLGQPGARQADYIRDLHALFAKLKPVWFSEHLCFAAHGNTYFNDLLPMPFTQASQKRCIESIKSIQAEFEQPFLVENVSYYLSMNEDGLSETQWTHDLVEASDCGLLLDVNNVFVNAQNHGYDPYAFIEALPLSRVVEIHMAGHKETPDLIIDTHGEPVRAEVLALFAWTVPQCSNLKGVLLERDSNVPPLQTLLDELQTLKTAAGGWGATPAIKQQPVLTGVTTH